MPSFIIARRVSPAQEDRVCSDDSDRDNESDEQRKQAIEGWAILLEAAIAALKRQEPEIRIQLWQHKQTTALYGVLLRYGERTMVRRKRKRANHRLPAIYYEWFLAVEPDQDLLEWFVTREEAGEMELLASFPPVSDSGA